MFDTQGTDIWTLAGRTLRSRLIVGTGKYKDAAETRACLAASGAGSSPSPYAASISRPATTS